MSVNIETQDYINKKNQVTQQKPNNQMPTVSEFICMVIFVFLLYVILF